MEWYETEERAAFAGTAAKYAAWAGQNLPVEKFPERARPDQFNWEIAGEAARAGLLIAPLPERLGGVGLDGLGRAIVLERIARGRAGAAAIVLLHWAGLSALALLENDPGVASWLARFQQESGGERPWLCGVAVPESVVDGGAGFPSSLEESGERAILTGDWLCPLHPALAERVVVALPAHEGEARVWWLSGKELAPFCQEAYPGTGLLEMPIARLHLHDYEAPRELILARGDRAHEISDRIWQGLYAGLAAVTAGNAAAAAATAWEYAKVRLQTGRPIFEHQDLRRALEHLSAAAEAAWAMAVSAAAMPDSDQALDRARRAYAFSGSAGEEVCLDAIQCLGGYGYMEDYGLERRLRDQKTIQCLLGSYLSDWIGERSYY